MRILFLAGACLALLASLAVSHSEEESSTERMKKVQKYRIVKVYGRKLKTTTTTAPPLKITEPVTVTSNKTSASEELLRPRDMLRQESSVENTVNLGQMDLDNFDIAKLLAAAGHSPNGDPLAPTVVRFSAPSSESKLDSDYLSKLIREQLGNDPQFRILPPSGKNDGNNFSPIIVQPPAQGLRTTDAPPQQFRGGFKHAPSSISPVHQGNPTVKPNTYPAQRVTPPFDARNAKEIKHESKNGFQNQIQAPPQDNRQFQSTMGHYNNGNQNYQSIPKPPTPHIPSSTTTKTTQAQPQKFPFFPRIQAQSVKQSEVVNFSGFQVSHPPPTASAPVQTTNIGKLPAYSTRPTSITTEPHSGFQFEPSGYSTLSQHMTAPGLTPAITGQYGPQQHVRAGRENEVTAESGPRLPVSHELKYSTTLVRGFTDDSRAQAYIKYPQLPSTSSPPPSQLVKNQWKTSKEPPRYDSFHSPISGQASKPNFPQPPSRTLGLPREEPNAVPQSLPHPSTFKVLKPRGNDNFRNQVSEPGFGASDFYQQNQPSRSPSENYASYAKSIGWENNDAQIDYGVTPSPQPEYNHPSQPEYGANTAHGPPNIDYGPPKSEVTPVVSQYGPPSPVPQALAQYQTAEYNHQDAEIPQRLTKTIYVNLPPESRTTAKPYYRQAVLPQKHYKIVFVKAPTAPPPEEPEIEMTPLPETKTIIYVLHKKPEPAKKIVIKVPPPTKPSPPEVFFIQYKDKKDEKDYEEQNVKWEDPLGNQGWERSAPQGYSPPEVDATNNWAPIYNSNESRSHSDASFQNGVHHNNESPYPNYQMSASAPVSAHVSVTKTVTTKI